MAEIRKHDPSKGNAFAQALRAAMGEEIRPSVPGPAAPTKAAATEPTGSTTWVNLSFGGAKQDQDEDSD